MLDPLPTSNIEEHPSPDFVTVDVIDDCAGKKMEIVSFTFQCLIYLYSSSAPSTSGFFIHRHVIVVISIPVDQPEHARLDAKVPLTHCARSTEVRKQGSSSYDGALSKQPAEPGDPTMLHTFEDLCSVVYVIVDEIYQGAVQPYDQCPGARSDFTESELLSRHHGRTDRLG